MIENQDLKRFSTPAELAEIVESAAASAIGIVVSADECALLFNALESLLARTNRKVVRVAPGEAVSDRLAPKPAPREVPSLTPPEWQERLIAELREEQQRAQQRVQESKQAGAAPDPLDRDIASWLAAGLGDLLGDPITGAAFMVLGKGAIARLAKGEPGARFSKTDFLRPDGIRFMDASRPAQSMLTKLSLSSTNQFRVAAAQLMNRIVDRLAGSEAETVTPASASGVLLVENAMSLAGFAHRESAITLVVAAPEESSLLNALPATTMLYHYGAPVAEIPHLQAPVKEVDLLGAAFEAEVARARLFIDRGVINELPQAATEERSSPALKSLRETLARAWTRWFSTRLADFDAERFLSFEEFDAFTRTVAFIQDSWQAASEIRPPMPATDRDFDLAESIFLELRRLEREWNIVFSTPVEQGMAFDAAVEAGGAPLDMLTEELKWWLRQENKDWDKYRIVRIK